MKVTTCGEVYEVKLVDDGTMDTVIEWTPERKTEWTTERIDADTAADYRNADGQITDAKLRALFVEVVMVGPQETWLARHRP